MENKIEFETYRSIGRYEIGQLKRDEPSAINFLSYRKHKITIELIDESNNVLIERLQDLLVGNNNHHQRHLITNEIDKLKKNYKR